MEEARRADAEKVKAKLSGNPMFKMPTDSELETIAKSMNLAEGAITDEDLALDRELEEMAKQNRMPQGVEDGPVVEVKRTKETAVLFNEGEPVGSHPELMEMIHQAKVEGYDSIEATEALIKQIFRPDYEHIKSKTGYGIYNDIKVYMAGYFDKYKNADKLTMEEKLHKK